MHYNYTSILLHSVLKHFGPNGGDQCVIGGYRHARLVVGNLISKVTVMYALVIGRSWCLQQQRFASQVKYNYRVLICDSDIGVYNYFNLCRYTLMFVFGELLYQDIKEFVYDWNNHLIRKNKLSTSPSGRPCDLYEMPEFYG